MGEAEALQFLVDRCGGLEGLHPSSKMAKLFKHGGPSKTREFRRIHAMPRRRWNEDLEIDELVERLSDYLSISSGTKRLWPVQAIALRNAYEQHGLFGPIAVGKGKAWISVLVAVLLEAARPLLIVPAALREQTNNFVIPEMREHWRLPDNLTTITYWDLSQEKNARLLEELRPDLVIADEVHHFKNKDAGRTKRITRWMKAEPGTAFVALSGTVTNRSIKDYAHILRWCLGENTPLPETWQELSQWADVLDVMDEENEGSRSPAGALAEWAIDGKTVRQGYRDRLVETPGVVATQETELGVSLRLLSRSPQVPDKIAILLARMALTWETPNGDMITEAVQLWRHARELCCGFWYKWSPAPPREWMDARKEYKKYVRDTLRNNRRKLDTELQVWRELAKAHGQPNAPKTKSTEDEEGLPLPNAAAIDAENKTKQAAHEVDLAKWRSRLDEKHCFWCKWVRLKDTFKINSVPQWVDDFAIDDATKWLNEERGIVWTEHNAFGERLEKVSGFRYFGPGKKANKQILTHTEPMIASIKAHGEGKNLQHHHSKALVASPSSSGKTWEQLLGRKHRDGQKANEVIYWVYRHADELRASIKKAFGDARYLEHTLGSKQKLLYADKDFEVM